MPCRWAIPNTSAMARSTTSRLGSGGLPIFIVLFIIRPAFWWKKRPDGSDVPCSGRFRSLPIPLRISGHPAVQIVRTEFTVYLDLPHFAEMLGHSLCKTAHSNDSGVASACWAIASYAIPIEPMDRIVT